MPGLLPDVDPDGLLEYSVVYTDRSLNHMAQSFQRVMLDISSSLQRVYGAQEVAIVPGGGTYAMEAVARQFATARKCLVIRNGFFSYRWSQIFAAGSICDSEIVLKARPVEPGSRAPFAPAPLDQVLATIERERPAVVFAPHVETASGMILPGAYMQAVGEAARAAGALFVLDCIASGAVWVDMRAANVDVLISAPQKGWSASPCAGLVMLGERAVEAIAVTQSTSFACDLKKWLEIMRAYEGGAHAYHATMPTDSLRVFRDTLQETESFGFESACNAQWALGRAVRELLESRGFASVAADGFQAPGVVVSYTDQQEIHNGSKFAARGLQIAAGVPLQCDEPDDYRSFRIGLFGLDKLADIERTVSSLDQAIRGMN